MSYYGRLCTLVYDLDKPEPPTDELDYYLSYVKNTDMKILEPMCGSGRFLIPFLRRGLNIEGFDISDSMLSACVKKASAEQLKANVTKAFVGQFQSSHLYDYIFIPSGSFSLLVEKDEAVSGLENMYSLLGKNGMFVVTIVTDELKEEPVEQWKKTKSFTIDDKQLIEYEMSEYKSSQLLQIRLKYELVAGDGVIVEKEEMDFPLKLYSLDEMEELLMNSGFTQVKLSNHEDCVATYECRK